MTDNIKNPKHYQLLEDVESIDIIARYMTVEQFKGFCLGSIIKYRLRAGNKDHLEQDIAKAEEFKKIFEKKKYLCRQEINLNSDDNVVCKTTTHTSDGYKTVKYRADQLTDLLKACGPKRTQKN